MYVYPIAVMYRLTELCSSVKEVTAKIEEIKVRTLTRTVLFSAHGSLQNDPSIPIRSNKKAGVRSKKELREEVHRVITTLVS